MGRARSKVVFVNLESATPGVPGANWQASHYEPGHAFPTGVAWLLAPPPGMPVAADPVGPRPIILYVLVGDEFRRRGVTARLVRACRRRWPSVELSGPVSAGGAALCRKFRPRPT